jgi:tRNA-dihydrouridine synthase B
LPNERPVPLLADPRTWRSPTLLAPLHGVGAASVRELLVNCGPPGVVCAPFLRVTSQPPNLDWFRQQVQRTRDVPLSVQLLGSHPEHLAAATRCLVDAGVDVVDLNLGCPVRTVVRRGVGAALLSQIERIREIVAAMRAACSARLSVKFRSGDSGSSEVVHIAQAIEAMGADFLVLHPRTRIQGYGGVADWELVKSVKAAVKIPVIGNGDCWYATDSLRLLQTSGADAVMLGRPALRNPYIFRQIDDLRAGREPFRPTARHILDHIYRLADVFRAELSHTRSGPAGALKEQIQFLLRAVPPPARQLLWQRASQAHDLDAVLEAIRPLSDQADLDLLADGPYRFESTPADPSEIRLAPTSCSDIFPGNDE